MIVVVGAGLAGLQTVVALREQGYAGPLTLLGAEDEPPYDRPPLTKELLRGEVDATTLDADWAALDVDLRLGVRVESVGDGRAGDRPRATSSFDAVRARDRRGAADAAGRGHHACGPAPTPWRCGRRCDPAPGSPSSAPGGSVPRSPPPRWLPACR